MRALEGVRVLDLSQFLSGPRCTQILASLGADVVKVEAPSGETMRLLMSLTGAERSLSTLHHDKRGIVVNLKTDAGRGVLRDLIVKADVLVENLAPGTLDGMGLGYEDVRRLNPRLVYAAISGFGRTGPAAGRMAFDIIAQATGGIMSANGVPDRPPGVFFGDLNAGAYAAIGVLAALRQRERTGCGQLIDLSMQDVMYYHNYWGFSEKANEPVRDRITALFGRPVTQLLTDRENPMPFWNSYPAKDGHVAVVALTDRQWEALLRVIGREDLLEDERFSNLVARIKNAAEGVRAIEAWTRERTVGEVVQALAAARIPCGAVAGLEEVTRDPQLLARGMIREVRHARLGPIAVPGFPIRLSGAETDPRTACPDIGEHTDQVLAEWLGLDGARIAALRQEGAIG